MRHCQRSEAISLARSRYQEIAASLALLAKTVKLEVPLFKFIKRSEATKQSPNNRLLSSPGLHCFQLSRCYVFDIDTGSGDGVQHGAQ